MAPFVPYHTAAGDQKLVTLGGLITTEWLEPPPGRCFMMRQTYRHTVEGEVPESLQAVIDAPNRPKGPAPHFHPRQVEYFRVERGVMNLHKDGKDTVYTPEDGELVVHGGTIHCFSIHPSSPGPMTVYISSTDSGADQQLDRAYLENWYGYQHDVLLHEGGKFDWIQWYAIHDGGSTYYPPGPSWLPFRQFLGFWITVIVGRWIGGLLGYRPFFREFTTDYSYAVAKMKGSIFQRHLVQDAWTEKASWEQQMSRNVEKVSDLDSPYDYLLLDVDSKPLHLDPPQYQSGNWVAPSGAPKKVNGVGLHKVNGF